MIGRNVGDKILEGLESVFLRYGVDREGVAVRCHNVIQEVFVLLCQEGAEVDPIFSTWGFLRHSLRELTKATVLRMTL